MPQYLPQHFCARQRERGSTTDWFGMPTKTGALLEAYTLTGVRGLARRDGNRRYYDLLERLVPAKLLDCCPRSSTG